MVDASVVLSTAATRLHARTAKAATPTVLRDAAASLCGTSGTSGGSSGGPEKKGLLGGFRLTSMTDLFD